MLRVVGKFGMGWFAGFVWIAGWYQVFNASKAVSSFTATKAETFIMNQGASHH